MRRLTLLALILSWLPLLAQTRVVSERIDAIYRPVSARLVPPVAIDDELHAVWRVVLTNGGAAPVRHFWFRVRFDFRDSIVSMPDGCAPEVESNVRCVVDVGPMDSQELAFTIRHRALIGHAFASIERITGDREEGEAVFAHPFFVTNVDDSGFGSLRQAILDINAICAASDEPCGVVFRIDGPVPEDGWFTIRPQTPLPTITAPDVVLDGGTQSRYSGETNPFDGPEIVLDGSAVAAGHGLHFLSKIARVADLAIGGFPGNGIAGSLADRTAAERCWLGVDGSGRVAAPNGLRGVEIHGGDIRIVDNVMSGNHRAGGFFVTTGGVEVRRNRIGVGADGSTALGNGASGIYIDKPGYGTSPQIAAENIIANNAHAGIALSRGAMAVVGDNTFYNNAGLAIDIGIDGDSREMKPGLPGYEGSRLGAPIITSARFENGETIIEGEVAEHPTGAHYGQGVFIYAGSSPRNAEVVVAVISPRSWLNDRRFIVHVPVEIRDLWISAAAFMELGYLYDSATAGTSELSEPRRME